MKRLRSICAGLAAAAGLAGCYKHGSPAPAPANVQVLAGDTRATVTWTADPGVEYWVFYAPSTSVPVTDITTQNWYLLTGARVVVKAVSPVVIPGLVNCATYPVVTASATCPTYSFTVNGRIDGGPGGPGSLAVSAVPRLAGGTWTAGSGTVGTVDLRGIAYSGSQFVAVGTGPTVYASTDGAVWAQQTATCATAPICPNLNAATYGGTFVAAGDAGLVLTSSDGVTWTEQAAAATAAVSKNMFGAGTNGTGTYVAVGQAGTIVYNSSGLTAWTGVGASVNDLHGVAYGNGRYIAVGAAGTILSSGSTSPASWTPVTSPTGNLLSSVAYGTGVNGVAGSNMFVAVGASGTMVTSLDGVTWALVTGSPCGPGSLNSVTYGHQFVAVGDAGVVCTSVDGLTWAAAASSPLSVSNLVSVAHTGFGYCAVGQAGANFCSY